MSIKLMMLSNHLILCRPLLLLLLIFPSIVVLSNKLALYIRGPKYLELQRHFSPSDEYSGLISFRIDGFDLLAVQGTLKSVPQHHSLKASILQHLAFFMVQLLTSVHDYWKNHSFDSRDLCQQSDGSDAYLGSCCGCLKKKVVAVQIPSALRCV